MIRSFLITCVLVLGLASVAAAQDEATRAQAREQFGLGVQRYEAGQYAPALEAFQEAFRLAPHPTVHVNMANCYEHLGRPLEALAHFERFLAEAEGASRAQRREVTAAIARLTAQLGELRLSIAPDGATVTIDGTETRRAPILEPIRLPAGPHQIEVRMDGFLAHRHEITLAAGDAQRLTIRLERGTPPVAVAEPAPNPAEGTPAEATAEATATETAPAEATTDIPPEEGTDFQLRLTLPVLIAGGAAAAFALTAIITGSIAVASNSDFENAVIRTNDPSLSDSERNIARQQGLDAASTANTTSVLTDIFLIGAIAAAGATVFFVIIDGLNPEAQSVIGSRSGPRFAAAPSVGRDGGGFVLTGSF